jgi:sugar transferase EpsL
MSAKVPYRLLKRSVDLGIAVLLLFLSAPLILFIALLVRIFLGSPVLFRQLRTGLHGRTFTLHKFRTMTDARGKDGEVLPDADRITPLGRWLRRTSLDELPQLIDVVSGNLSLVGPRPLLPEYLPLYDAEQARRHDVKPGITGWAQVNGRNAITWEEKFAHDLWYVEHQSLTLDLRILVMTLRRVAAASGIDGEGGARFTGTSSRGQS